MEADAKLIGLYRETGKHRGNERQRRGPQIAKDVEERQQIDGAEQIDEERDDEHTVPSNESKIEN